MEVMIPSSGYYSFSITPDLPKGIELRYDGVIEGVPSEVHKETTYTITAFNLQDRREATTVIITVTDKQAPLLYHPDNVVILMNMTMMPLTPTSNYHNFTVNPTLPQGVIIQKDGVITGSPTQAIEETIFTIVAYSQEGDISSTTVTITIISEFYYIPKSVVLKVNEALTPMVPCAKLHNFLISPSLPLGLTLDTTTGYIKGIPTRSSPQTEYTVHASAGGPMITTKISITVEEEQATPSIYSTIIAITCVCAVFVIVVVILVVCKIRKNQKKSESLV